MDCIRAQQLIKGYMEGQLSDRDLEAFLDHVAGCRKCYDELEIYFSVYHLIDDRKDDGNYNFIEKLNLRLEKSRDYLRRRLYYKIFRVVLVVLAELVLMMSVIGAYTYRYRMDQEEIRSETGKKENPEGEASVDRQGGENGSGEDSVFMYDSRGEAAETIAAGPEETGSGTHSSDTEKETAETEPEISGTEAETGETDSESAAMDPVFAETEKETAAEPQSLEAAVTEADFFDTEAEEKALEKTREALYYVIGRPVPEEEDSLSENAGRRKGRPETQAETESEAETETEPEAETDNGVWGGTGSGIRESCCGSVWKIQGEDR